VSAACTISASQQDLDKAFTFNPDPKLPYVQVYYLLITAYIKNRHLFGNTYNTSLEVKAVAKTFLLYPATTIHLTPLN
jgi:hypothetical protein